MAVTKENLAAIRQHQTYIDQICAQMARSEPHGKLVLEYPGAPIAFYVVNKPGTTPTVRQLPIAYLDTKKPV